jgi:signal transduction histidine kinase
VEEMDSAKELFDIVDRNSKRINKLIEDLLNATRFDSMEFVHIELEQLINETLDLVNDRIRFKEIVVEKEVAKNISVRADKEKLIIALINIIVNSIEALEEKGGKIQIVSFGNEKSACIQVKDNGKGIHPDHLLKLFEPFFTSKKGGTGLGLSAAYNIITKHDGNIKVESKLGEGTVFSIFLPLV